MPTLEGLELASKVNNANTAGIVANDQMIQRQQAAQQAAELYKKGDVNGAIGVLSAVDPEFMKNSPLVMQAQTRAQTAGQLDAETPFGANKRQITDANNASAEKIAGMRADQAAKEAVNKVTPGMAEVDKEAAKAYNEFITKGGYTKTTRNINVLNDAMSILDNSADVSGAFQGSIPERLKPFVAGNNVNVKDLVSSVIFQSLKDTFPGQISDGERKALVDTAYNPSLPDAVNKGRLKTLMSEIKSVARARVEASRFFEDNGYSMRGYKGAANLDLDVGEVTKKLNGIGASTSTGPVLVKEIGQELAPGTQVKNKKTGEVKTVQPDGTLK